MKEINNIYCIINANSGKGAIKSRLVPILEILQQRFSSIQIYLTTGRADATVAAKTACNSEKFDAIVCSGGDGTLNEVINGIMYSKNPLPIGYIPAGTMNDFARCLGISRDMEAAAHSVCHGVPYRCDIGQFNDRFFTYVACLGAYTDVSYATPQNIKSIFGSAAYILECVRSTFGIRTDHLIIEYDGGVIEDDFVLGVISNSSSVAGIKMPTGVSVIDGEFEVLLVRAPRNPIEFQSVISRLIIQDTDNEYIRYFKASKLHITSDRAVPWCVDGEFGGQLNDVRISNLHLAVELLISPSGSDGIIQNDIFKGELLD